MLALTLALTSLYTSEAKSQLKISGDYLQIVDDLGQIFIFHVSHLEEGFQLRGQAQEIQLANGETFIPDIIAADQKTGEVIFIEVERDVNKDQMSRKQKWMKLYEASNGNLYVFCDNLNCQRAIQGEINLALGELVYNSFLTNLHGLRKGKRSEKDGSIWFSQRRGK